MPARPPPPSHPIRQYKLAGTPGTPKAGLLGRHIVTTDPKNYIQSITVCEPGRCRLTRASHVLFLHKNVYSHRMEVLFLIVLYIFPTSRWFQNLARYIQATSQPGYQASPPTCFSEEILNFLYFTQDKLNNTFSIMESSNYSTIRTVLFQLERGVD